FWPTYSHSVHYHGNVLRHCSCFDGCGAPGWSVGRTHWYTVFHGHCYTEFGIIPTMPKKILCRRHGTLLILCGMVEILRHSISGQSREYMALLNTVFSLEYFFSNTNHTHDTVCSGFHFLALSFRA